MLCLVDSLVTRHIKAHLHRAKAEGKRKIPFMFVSFSLIFFACEKVKGENVFITVGKKIMLQRRIEPWSRVIRVSVITV